MQTCTGYALSETMNKGPWPIPLSDQGSEMSFRLDGVEFPQVNRPRNGSPGPVAWILILYTGGVQVGQFEPT